MNVLNFLWIASLVGSFFSHHSVLKNLDTIHTVLARTVSVSHPSISTAIAGSFVSSGSHSSFQLLGSVATLRFTPQQITPNYSNPTAQRWINSVAQLTQTDRKIVSLLSVAVVASDVSVGVYEKRSIAIPTRSLWRCGQLSQMDGQKTGLHIDTLFQVQVNNRVVAELPTRQQADDIAAQLRELLERSDFDPDQVRPALINGYPGGRMKDAVVFTIDSTLERKLGRDGELLAIAWVNELRKALGVEPLKLAAAQTAMHGLAQTGKTLEGVASWYGPRFHGRLTANGEIYDQYELTAAHPSLPFDTYLQVTNVKNGRSVIVRINDRGPYVGQRSLDLSRAAARCLNSESSGVIAYKATILKPGDLTLSSPDPASTPGEQRVARR